MASRDELLGVLRIKPNKKYGTSVQETPVPKKKKVKKKKKPSARKKVPRIQALKEATDAVDRIQGRKILKPVKKRRK